jgi:glutathione-regulated potassium-efflux system ancillary protein KefC
MDFIWIVFAFVFGMSVRMLSLPPLVGYLVAGFTLHSFGIESSELLSMLSDLGITLMLFTIGLKLNIKSLLKPEVLVTTVSHMLVCVIIFSLLFWLLAFLSIQYFVNLELKTLAVIAFALSFSSTVCVVKVLEESGEIKTRHGRVAIGILVMQDIVAVVFMVVATGKIPSIWALALFALFFLRPLYNRLLENAGHGELMPLLGFFLAFGAYELFSLVDLKGELGALVIGALLSHHKKSTELYKSLMSFKDLFLIGFFLSIGFTALPNADMVIVAIMLVMLIMIKGALFYGILALMKFRARNAFLSSLILTNYSEFGLIVIALCVQLNWISQDWLVILALAVSFSFVLNSIIYRQAHNLYQKYNFLLKRFEHANPIRPSRANTLVNAKVLIIGMGRVGKGTYYSMHEVLGDSVWSMDADVERAMSLKKQGIQIFFGDGEDADLWETLNLENIELVLIALPQIADIQNIQKQLESSNFTGKVAAIARYEDQIQELKDCGIDRIFNFYKEAGVGFAKESLMLINGPQEKVKQPS